MKAKAAPSPRRRSSSSYHHGDLRQSLKSAALKVLEGPDFHALSFRELARELGVTTSAPYFHFKDRTALLVEIAIDGYDLLFQRMEQAVQASNASEATPEILALVYLEFALSERGYYRAMYLPEVSGAVDVSGLRRAADRNFDLVSRAMVRVRKHFSDKEVSDRATSVWSFLHGMVILQTSGRLGKRVLAAEEKSFCLEAVRRLLAE